MKQNKDNALDQTHQQDKGRRILEAAMEIFSLKPYHQVTVEEIALRACVGKGTVYEYYKSKDELFLAVFEEGGRIYLREMENSLKQEGSAVEKFTCLITTHGAFISHYRKRALLLVAEQRMLAPREVRQAFMERQSRLLSLVRGTIQQGIEEGAFRPVDVDMASVYVIGGIISLWSLAFSEEDNILYNREEEVVELVLKGLK
jgi:AcrR family transcriptional regulator